MGGSKHLSNLFCLHRQESPAAPASLDRTVERESFVLSLVDLKNAPGLRVKVN